MENTTPLPRTSRGLGLRSRSEGGGGSGREGDGGRQMEEGNLGRENPGDDRELVTGHGRQGGTTRRGKAETGHAMNTFGPPGTGGKRRRAVATGGRERHPGGWLLHDGAREGGRRRGSK